MRKILASKNLNTINEDFLDDYSYDSDSSTSSDSSNNSSDNKEIDKELLNDIYDTNLPKIILDKLISLVDETLKEIDSFKDKIYFKDEYKNMSSFSYEQVIKDLSPTNWMPIPSVHTSNTEKRYNAINVIIKNIIDSPSGIPGNSRVMSSQELLGAAKTSAPNFYSVNTQGLDMSDSMDVGGGMKSNVNAYMNRCVQKDYVIIFAERLIVFKHAIEQLKDDIFDLSLSSVDITLLLNAAAEVYYSLYYRFFKDAEKQLELYNNGPKRSMQQWAGTDPKTNLIYPDSVRYLMNLAVSVMEYLNHNCRDLPDTHSSPLRIPKTIPIVSSPDNEDQSSISLNRFMFNCSFPEYSITEFTDQQFLYEYNKANERTRKGIKNFIESAYDSQASSVQKMFKRKYQTEQEIIDFANSIDIHKDVEAWLAKNKTFNILDLKPLCRNWFLRLFSAYYRTIYRPPVLISSKTQQFGIFNWDRFTDYASGYTYQNFSVIAKNVTSHDDKSVMAQLKQRYYHLMLSHFNDLFNDTSSRSGNTSIGSIHYTECIAMTELRQTSDSRATFSPSAIKKTNQFFTKPARWKKSVIGDNPILSNPFAMLNPSNNSFNGSYLAQIPVEDFKFKTASYKSKFEHQKKTNPNSPSLSPDANKSLVGVEKLLHRAASFTEYPYRDNDFAKDPKNAFPDRVAKSFSQDFYNYIYLIRPDLIETVKEHPTICQMKYGTEATPYLGRVGSKFTLNFSISDFFAESYDELYNALTKFSLYDPVNRLFDFEYEDLLHSRLVFATNIHEKFSNLLTTYITSSLSVSQLLNLNEEDCTLLTKQGTRYMEYNL